MNVYALLQDALGRSPDRAALVAGLGRRRRSLSFRELDRRVDAMVAAFRRRGLTPDDRVLLAAPVSIEMVVAMLAVLKAGLSVMFVDPAHGLGTVRQILRRYPPAAIISTRGVLLAGTLVPELRRIPHRFAVGAVSPSSTGRFDAARRRPTDPALLTFTSGSTGEPKAVVRSHDFLLRQQEILNRVAVVSDQDIDFVAMPMFVLFNAANGITSIVPACNMRNPGRADPRIVLRQLLQERATRIVAAPALLERLANHCMTHHHMLPALRDISTGGGPIDPGLPDRLASIAPRGIIRMVYGCSEAEPIACELRDHVTAVDRQNMRRGEGLLAGRPVRGCAVRIIASMPGKSLGPYTVEGFANTFRGVGDIGEIVVAGAHVLQGYADPGADRDTKIRVDNTVWHRTGDAGYFDPAGRLWLVGRCSAAFASGTDTVYPFQVEYPVNAIPGVRRSALLADDHERVLILETVRPELDTRCMRAAEVTAGDKIDRIETVRRLPLDRRHATKIDYPALRSLLQRRRSRIRRLLPLSPSRDSKPRRFPRLSGARCISAARTTSRGRT